MRNNTIIFNILTTVLLSMPSAHAEIASGSWANGTEGSGTWSISDDGTLTLSGTGAIGDYQRMYYGTVAPWNDSASSVKKIVINDGITNVGKMAFDSMKNLESIDVPDSLKINYANFQDREYLWQRETAYTNATNKHEEALQQMYWGPGQACNQTVNGWDCSVLDSNPYISSYEREQAMYWYNQLESAKMEMEWITEELEEYARQNANFSNLTVECRGDVSTCKNYWENINDGVSALSFGWFDTNNNILKNYTSLEDIPDANDEGALDTFVYNGTRYNKVSDGEDGYTYQSQSGETLVLASNNTEPSSEPNIPATNNTQRSAPKRIYTVEEAEKISKPTGNTFRLRYK
ncbi:MAG: hypothetical protein IJ870_01310 [Alphaproteobacteria bacterium]|nr:hypothetical protein [Alphaproteobacteria bacterium]